ncbi:hypothetical protein ACF0H5_014478 [Mactra antiquata]
MRKISLLSILVILATVYHTVYSVTCYDDSLNSYRECDQGCCGTFYDDDRRCCEDDKTNYSTIYIGGGIGGSVGFIIFCVICYVCCCK